MGNYFQGSVHILHKICDYKNIVALPPPTMSITLPTSKNLTTGSNFLTLRMDASLPPAFIGLVWEQPEASRHTSWVSGASQSQSTTCCTWAMPWSHKALFQREWEVWPTGLKKFTFRLLSFPHIQAHCLLYFPIIFSLPPSDLSLFPRAPLPHTVDLLQSKHSGRCSGILQAHCLMFINFAPQACCLFEYSRSHQFKCIIWWIALASLKILYMFCIIDADSVWCNLKYRFYKFKKKNIKANVSQACKAYV